MAQFKQGSYYRLKSGIPLNNRCVIASDLEEYNPVSSYYWNIELQLHNAGIRYAVPVELMGGDNSLYYDGGSMTQLNEYDPNTYLISGSQTHYLTVDYKSFEYNLPLPNQDAFPFGGNDMMMWCSDYLMVQYNPITLAATSSNINRKSFSKEVTQIGPIRGEGSYHDYFKFYTSDGIYGNAIFMLILNVDDITDLSSNVYCDTGFITAEESIDISGGVLTRTTIINEIVFVGTIG